MRLMPWRRREAPAPPGPLVIVGGAEDRSSSSVILRKLVSLCRTTAPRIVVIDAASRVPSRFAREYRRTFLDLGARDVDTPRLDAPSDAQDRAFVRMLEDADLVYFAGGDQSRLVNILLGSAALDLLRARHKAEEVVVGGTSAGAAALSRRMIARGESDLWPRKGYVRLADGLGFTDVVIDQHFSQRGRLGRLMEALLVLGEGVRGVGVDENTALVLFSDGSGEVIGEGGVAILSVESGAGGSWHDAGHHEIVSGCAVTMRILRHGDRVGGVVPTPVMAARQEA